MNKFRKYFRTGGLCVLLLLGIMWFAKSNADENSDNKKSKRVVVVNAWSEMPNDEISKVIQEPIKQIQDGLIAAINEGRIRSSELDRLNFIQPDTDGFGKDLDYEVFNPDSRRSIVLNKKFEIPQTLFDQITEIKQTRLIFNLRRLNTSGSDTVTENLYVIIPYMKAESCTKLGPIQFKKIEIAKDNTKVIEDAKSFTLNCLDSGDGKLYLPISILSRNRKATSTDWLP